MVAALCGFPARLRPRPHTGPAPRRRYERRRPEKTPLHTVISENLASWLEWRDQAERPVPGHVEEEASARRATVGTWHRPPPISSIT